MLDLSWIYAGFILDLSISQMEEFQLEPIQFELCFSLWISNGFSELKTSLPVVFTFHPHCTFLQKFSGICRSLRRLIWLISHRFLRAVVRRRHPKVDIILVLSENKLFENPFWAKSLLSDFQKMSCERNPLWAISKMSLGVLLVRNPAWVIFF